jgi:hypothetical protein
MLVYSNRQLVEELFKQQDESARLSKLLDSARDRAVEADAAYRQSLSAKDATIVELRAELDGLRVQLAKETARGDAFARDNARIVQHFSSGEVN